MKTLAVLLPTYNCAIFLEEAVQSILGQTFRDFDLFVFDDCSTDNTFEIINRFNDKRIFYYKNDKNLGLSTTLNIGLELLLPSYEFIARMDADDWCDPTRFEKQLSFLTKNPQYALCGTQGYWLKDLKLTPDSGWRYPTSDHYLRIYLLFAASFGHSSLILRSHVFLVENYRYNDLIQTCEDWDLWTRIAPKYAIANLPEFLMKYRIMPNSNHRSIENQEIHVRERTAVIAAYFNSFQFPISQKNVFDFFYNLEIVNSKNFYENLNLWITVFNKLFKATQNRLSVDEQKNFSFMMARKIKFFIQKNDLSVFKTRTWFYVFSRTKFIGFYRLLKSQIF